MKLRENATSCVPVHVRALMYMPPLVIVLFVQVVPSGEVNTMSLVPTSTSCEPVHTTSRTWLPVVAEKSPSEISCQSVPSLVVARYGGRLLL